MLHLTEHKTLHVFFVRTMYICTYTQRQKINVQSLLFLIGAATHNAWMRNLYSLIGWQQTDRSGEQPLRDAKLTSVV
jgi:hypothetical protein